MKRAPKDFDDGRMTTGNCWWLVVGVCCLIAIIWSCWALYEAVLTATRGMP